jgi:hypothetical protein
MAQPATTVEKTLGEAEVADVKLSDHTEDAGYQNSPREIQSRFDLLRDLSEAEMETLNKTVLRKVDWRMMPTITIMFLMWYARLS